MNAPKTPPETEAKNPRDEWARARAAVLRKVEAVLSSRATLAAKSAEAFEVLQGVRLYLQLEQDMARKGSGDATVISCGHAGGDDGNCNVCKLRELVETKLTAGGGLRR